MATIKLMDNVWLEQEVQRVLGVLRSDRALGGKDGQAGKDVSTLLDLLRYAGLDYTAVQLTAIRDKLVADGMIEVLP